MSLEEMAKAYSEKWKVPIEEATKQIQKFLAKKPAGAERAPGPGGMPEAGNIFPDPLGPISKKFQDINQAILSGAYTRKTLKEMSQPLGKFKTLSEKVEAMEKNVETVVSLVNTTMTEWKDTLDANKAEKEREKLVEEIKEKVIKPLREKVEALEQEKGGNGEGVHKLTTEEIFETGQKLTKDAQGWLNRLGFKVELPKALTMEQVEAKLKENVTKEKEKWEKESGATVEIERERIQATTKILTGITDRLMDMILVPIKAKFEEAIEKGAFTRAPPPT